MELRPYQEQAVESILGEWDSGHQHTLLVLPTGTGKTVVFSKVVEKEVNKGEKALILAHRGQLLDQASDKIPAELGGDLYLINGNMLPLNNAGAYANTNKEEEADEEVLELEKSSRNRRKSTRT